jgi:hypothetical protein
MKYLRLLLLVGIVPLFQICNAQTTIFGVGYNASFMKPKTVNKIIGRYNETRSWLSEPMESINYIDGAVYTLNWINEIYFLDLTYARRVTTISAKGNPGTGEAQRDIKFKANTFNLGMGLNLMNEGPYVSLGFDFDFGANKIETRVNTTDQIKDTDYEEVMDPLTIGSSLFLQIVLSKEKGLGISIRPYYYFDLMSTNYTWFNEAINPNTYMNDDFDQYGKLNHFGIMIKGVVAF